MSYVRYPSNSCPGTYYGHLYPPMLMHICTYSLCDLTATHSFYHLPLYLLIFSGPCHSWPHPPNNVTPTDTSFTPHQPVITQSSMHLDSQSFHQPTLHHSPTIQLLQWMHTVVLAHIIQHRTPCHSSSVSLSFTSTVATVLLNPTRTHPSFPISYQ